MTSPAVPYQDCLLWKLAAYYLQEIAAQPLLQPLMASGKVQIVQWDLTKRPQAHDLQGKPISLLEPPFQAVFCNYVFDTLPVAVYQLAGQQWREKWVRTEVREQLSHPLPSHYYALKDTLFISEFCDIKLESVSHPWIQSFLSAVQHKGQTGLYPVSEVSLKALDGLYSLLAPAGLLWLADKGFLAETGLSDLDFWPQTYGLKHKPCQIDFDTVWYVIFSSTIAMKVSLSTMFRTVTGS